jgi:hypothetical protein
MRTRTALVVALCLIVVEQLLGAVIDNLNRTLVEMPAWQHLGAQAWATFSRSADLGNGTILYPLAGIGGLVLILAAAIAFRLGPRRPLFVAIPVYGAALMGIGIMLTTTQAAPIMLGLRRIGDDPRALQQAFEGFYRWDSIRAVIGVLKGFAEIWALVALSSLAFEKKSPSQEQGTITSAMKPETGHTPAGGPRSMQGSLGCSAAFSVNPLEPQEASMKRALAVVSIFLCSALALAQAQNPSANNSPAPVAPAHPTKDPVATALRQVLQHFQNDMIGAVEAMPADKFLYKPTADQNTFAHLAADIANTNNRFCSQAADVPAPRVDEPKETDSKDKLVAAVKASFNFCSDALSKMDDSKLGDTIELFGRGFPRSLAALGLASSLSDHSGMASMYLHLNGIWPPSAQPKR